MKYTAPRRQSPAHTKSHLNGCPMNIIANGMNTLSEMTSCIIFSCGKVYTVKPIRLAGTMMRYSQSAIPQLTRAAIYQAFELIFLR